MAFQFTLLWSALPHPLPVSFLSVYDLVLVNCRSSLYILENIPLSVFDIANIFFPSFFCLQTLLLIYFIENKSFWCNKKVLFKCSSHPKIFCHVSSSDIQFYSWVSYVPNMLLFVVLELIHVFFENSWAKKLIFERKEEYDCRPLWGTKK